jgi:NarL family two-component system sensor histidine kinase YdfH
MKPENSPSQSLRGKTVSIFKSLPENSRAVWPFFVILTLAMAYIYASMLHNDPTMYQPLKLVPVTVLLLVHIVLHWLSPALAVNPKYGLLYLTGQTIIVIIMVLITHSDTFLLGLFMGLVGETLGIIRPLRRSLIAVVGLLILAAVTHGQILGWVSAPGYLLTVIPMSFFVIVYVYLYTRQIEERARAEKLLKELEITHHQLEEYASRNEELTLANERQRMARELHDTLAQGLAGVILQLEAAEQHLSQNRPERARTIVEQAMSRARSTLAEARQVIDDLRANRPASSDLIDALENEVQRFTALTGLPCKLEVASPPELTDHQALQIEKMVSEALTNIARHARAQHAWIKLTSQNGQVKIEIGDDGQGFDPEDIQSGHYGLVGIRERARISGGSLNVESAGGQGTRLQISLPLQSKSNPTPEAS